jgi:septal ring factor EnvC (AmiA/AmiB activator)
VDRPDVRLKDMSEQEDIQQETVSDANKKQTKHSVFIYVTIMFGAVVLLILLSHFIQQRNSSITISSITEQHGKFSTQALDNIEELQNRNIELMEELSSAQARIEELENEVENARQQLTDELKNTEEVLTAKYNELSKEKQALEYLLDAETALNQGDNTTAREKLRLLESVADCLADTYRIQYENLKERAG